MQITKDTLDKLRSKQQKSHYGSQARAMFVDGFFNYDNWNGGDGIIRQYFSAFNNGIFMDTKVTDIDFTFNSIHFWGDIVITHTSYDDQSYAIITFRGNVEIDEKTVLDTFEHTAYFTWYKSRGRTESGKFDGKLMTEEEYLFVLNAIQSTGFKFELN